MINNRMLAVAAVLVMAVPALGAATPIVVPPVPEQLVEGHTVFTVIEIVAATQTNETRFAAAVAVLVREYTANERAQRFPGVLWFNDQYLVNPYQNANAAQSFRYPCGGAVIAVNRGDPDPRMAIARVAATTPEVLVDGTTVVPALGPVGATLGYAPPTDYAWIGVKPGGSVDVNSTSPTDSTVTLPTIYSDTVVGATLGGIDGTLGNASPPWDYRESYLITDPNDHSWVIDKYEFYTRDSNDNSQNLNNLEVKDTPVPPVDSDGDGIADDLPSEHSPIATDPINGRLETQYAYPVWVVNMLGSPVFLPDNTGPTNCLPFKDLIEALTAPVNGALCGVAVPNPLGTGGDDEITLNAYNGLPPYTDDPCMSYEEPSRNGFCYGGQTPDANGCTQGTPAQCRNNRGNPCEPLRQYNALLYFKLEDLRIFGAPRDHCNYDPTLDINGDGVADGGCNPALSGDTNGCSEEQSSGGPNSPRATNDWPCPTATAAGANGETTCNGPTNGAPAGEDDCEGNSHPFHPTTPSHDVAESCRPEFYYAADPNAAGPERANPTNHGGSSYITPGMQATDDGWYEITAPCDYLHATRNIDIYYNGGGRPFPPVVRVFDVIDLEGSSAPFNDYHCAYETTPAEYPCSPSESEDPLVAVPEP